MFCNFTKADLDKYIYRIISLERLVELFSTELNTLVKPEMWEDTFENFILKSKVKLLSGEVIEGNLHESIYGQCWTLHNASDAMWRIYSPNKYGLRIRTTVRCLLQSIYEANPSLPDAKCCLGKVEYLTENYLMKYANSIFDDSGISVENIFKSVLVKRNAFKHENEVRLLYDSWGNECAVDKIYRYKIDPHMLISQIMIDPRRSCSEYRTIKLIIEKTTGYRGPIKRSLLYALPKERILNVTNILGD